MNCKFCGKVCKSSRSKTQHEIRCKKNSNRILPKPKTDKWYEAMHKRKGNATNQFIKAKQLGLPSPKVSDETKQKISETNKKYVWTEERKKKHSLIMKEVVKNNPESYSKNNVSGRVKIINYNGVNLKGTWEVKTAKWLDSLGLDWENEKYSFNYYYNNNVHLYFPDFYIPSYNTFIEVKGYKTDKDEEKWKQFKGNLIIIDKNVINQLDSFSFEEIIIKCKHMVL